MRWSMGFAVLRSCFWCFLFAAMSPAAEKAISGDRIPTAQGDLIVHPVQHATFVMQWNGKTIAVDPVGGAKAFADLPQPDLVLITHLHGDHLDPETLKALIPADSKTPIVAPKSVLEKLPEPLRERTTVLANGQKTKLVGIEIEALPAYNTSVEKQKFHPKGRDNGYLLRLGGKTVYIAGDTEDTPEMRQLVNIDVAFLPVNLPYTMSVEQAAEAAKAFKPKILYPYHYRGTQGKSDLEQLKKLIGPESGVEVRLREWYGGAKRD